MRDSNNNVALILPPTQSYVRVHNNWVLPAQYPLMVADAGNGTTMLGNNAMQGLRVTFDGGTRVGFAPQQA